jgi:hypothetical protein
LSVPIVPAAALLCLVFLAGCGSGGKGLQGPDIGKAKSFEIAGFEPGSAVKPGVPTTVTFHIQKPSGGALTTFKTGSGPHTGVHLILVRNDLSVIIHRHPPIAADGTVTQSVTFPSAGPWHALVDVYPDLGANTLPNFQLSHAVMVDGAYSPKPLPAPAAAQTIDGDHFAIKLPKTIRSLRPQFFDVTVADAAGAPAKFSTWYGATAHAIFFKRGTLDYFHTHVCRPEDKVCSKAVSGTSVAGKASKPGQLTVGALLPSAGTWELFLQAKVDGRIVTAPYTLKVS